MKKDWKDILNRMQRSVTHTPTFNGPFSMTTRVGRYQKGKTKLDFTEARHSDWQWPKALVNMFIAVLLLIYCRQYSACALILCTLFLNLLPFCSETVGIL